MNTQNQLERAESILARWAATAIAPKPGRLTIELGAEDLLAAVHSLVDARWGYLAAITGLDPGVETGTLWILYHFAEGAAVVTLKVVVPRYDAAVPTIRHLISLAGIFEQELTEVLGVTIASAVAHGRLFLPDDWPDGVYPLRKDFEMA